MFQISIHGRGTSRRVFSAALIVYWWTFLLTLAGHVRDRIYTGLAGSSSNLPGFVCMFVFLVLSSPRSQVPCITSYTMWCYMVLKYHPCHSTLMELDKSQDPTPRWWRGWRGPRGIVSLIHAKYQEIKMKKCFYQQGSCIETSRLVALDKFTIFEAKFNVKFATTN